MSATIRVATPEDAEAILAIYAPIVRETAISFEVEPPTRVEMQAAHRQDTAATALARLCAAGEVLGYVYASPHRARAAYQWSVDVTVYIQAQARRTGIGRALYHALFAAVDSCKGFTNCYAGITLPNPASVGLHEALGFQPVGVYQAVGYKLGAWHDVGWWQRGLPAAPESPHPADRVRGAAADLDRVGGCARRRDAAPTGVRSMCHVSRKYHTLSRQEEKTTWTHSPTMISAPPSVPGMARLRKPVARPRRQPRPPAAGVHPPTRKAPRVAAGPPRRHST